MDDIDIHTGGSSSIVPWILAFLLLGGAAFQALQLREVVYSGVPGRFLGTDINQIQIEEAMVNEAATRVFAAPDFNAPVLFNAQSGTRIKVLERVGDFIKLPLPQGQIGYIELEALTPGYLFLDSARQREKHEKRLFPKRFTRVTSSEWEAKSGGRSVLAVEVANDSAVPIDGVSLRIFFKNEVGITQEFLDIELEGRVEAKGRFDWENVQLRLPSGKRYQRSEILVMDVIPGSV